MLNGKSILVTGGTGSFGKKFIETVLRKYPKIKRLVIFSRDELKQFEMSQKLSVKEYPQLRYFIGDVRDEQRIIRACEGIDIIIHAAAMKQVPASEDNPLECIKTNIVGAQNIITAAVANNVEKVVALSTDKAAAPVNLYGATKLCSDKLFVAANNLVGSRSLSFSVVRYGNVLGSRGSVIPFFLRKKLEKATFLPVTDERMTRFNITLVSGVQLVLDALEKSWGGEIFIPKIPSYRILDVAEAVAPEIEVELVGIRPGEKIHEEMITESDALNTYDLGDYYVILPARPRWSLEEFQKHHRCKRVADGFSYSSGDNTEWMSIEELRSQIRECLDPNFSV